MPVFAKITCSWCFQKNIPEFSEEFSKIFYPKIFAPWQDFHGPFSWPLLVKKMCIQKQSAIWLKLRCNKLGQIGLKNSILIFIMAININSYFNLQDCLSMSVIRSFHLCVQKLAWIPKVIYQNVTNKSCLVCVNSDKCAFWVHP